MYIPTWQWTYDSCCAQCCHCFPHPEMVEGTGGVWNPQMLWRCLWWFANRFKGNSWSTPFRHLFPLGTNPSLPQPCLKWHLLGLFHVPPPSPTSLPRHDLSHSAQRFVHHPHGVFLSLQSKEKDVALQPPQLLSCCWRAVCNEDPGGSEQLLSPKNYVASNFPSRGATALFFPCGKMNRCTNEWKRQNETWQRTAYSTKLWMVKFWG